MLHYKSVDPKLLGLLKKLQGVPEFGKLRLAGGTSLALQIGHRKSIDIDLFGEIDIDAITISQLLNPLGSLTKIHETENIHIYSLDTIKVDIVKYPYKWIDNPVICDDLILASTKDIAALKLYAILDKGTKNDYIDLHFLLKQYKMEELLQFYQEKYYDGSLFLVVKSMMYFEDADLNEMPFMLENVKWNEIKNSITSKVKKYLN